MARPTKEPEQTPETAIAVRFQQMIEDEIFLMLNELSLPEAANIEVVRRAVQRYLDTI